MLMNRLLVVVLSLVLTACGGGGSSDSSSSAGTGSGGASSANCTASPVIPATTKFLGVVPTGKVGEWHFDTAARTSSYSVDGSSATPVLTRDDASCTFTTGGTLKTSFLSVGLAVSSATVAGVNLPALLIADPESSLSNVAGTYSVLRYEKDSQGTGSVKSSYATFKVDSAGSWRLCPVAAFSASCTGPTGTLASNAGGGFDVVAGGMVVGRMLAKVSGVSRVFVVSIADTSDPAGSVYGMWIGSSNDAFVSGANDGVYVTNTTDAGTSMLTLAGLTAKPEARPTAAPILANNPVQGAFAIVTGDPTNDVGIVSSLGLYADIAQATGTNAFMRFGVKQIK